MGATLSTHGLDVDDPLFAGRYHLRRLLKRGNGVETHLGTDTVTGVHLVIKLIDPSSVQPAARMRFEHEMQVLRELSGVGVAALFDSGQDADRLFLAQPLMRGETLEQVLRRGPMSLAAALRVGIDVASALDVAHAAGICHRDVKPANIVIDGTDPIRTVTLIDFGFARSSWLNPSIRDEMVGTVRYLAPEAAGSIAAPPDERSDLYALGVVLFECLAGHPPFPGPTVGDLLRQHMSMPVPELRTTAPAVPRSIQDVVGRLLRKDPAERYQSAAAVAADLAELLGLLAGGDADPRLVVGRSDRRDSLTDPSFVGRDAEVADLGAFVTGLDGDGAGIVLLEADSGGGKSRLLGEVSMLAQQAGVTVLRGQGIAQAGQRPFTLLLGVIDALLEMLEADASGRAALSRELHDVAPALVRAIPALSGLFGDLRGADVGPEQFGEARSITGLSRLLAAIASPQRPVLLVLDDCQWADTLTIRLLGGLFPPGFRPPHLGVIAAFRSEEVAVGHPLRRFAGARYVQLGGLSPQAMRLLAESMAGPLPEPVRESVVRLADGNPFMGAAVLRGMVESGVLVSMPTGWAVDEAHLRDVQAARRAAVLLVRRLELLGTEALRLLSVGAVLGKQFDVDDAIAMAGVPAGPAAAVIADARRRRLLWVDERSGQCSFFHDKVREALLERLSAADRRQLHSRAADVLLSRPSSGDAVFDLAYHLDAASRYTEALPHALAAAQRSRSRYALDAAASHYRMAARGIGRSDPATRVLVAEGLGDVLTLQGVYGEAEVQLAHARALVDDPVHAAELDGKVGALAFKQGDIGTAKQHLEGALAQLDRRIPRSRVGLCLALCWELLVQAAHTIARPLLVGHRKAAGHEVDFLAMRIYSRLAYLYWFHSGKLPCAWAHLRGLNLAERYPPSAELGQAYSEHAPVMTMLPWYRRGVRYAQRSLVIREELGDIWGQGQSLAFAGVVHYAASDFAPASQACTEAIGLLRRTGDQWEVNTASWHVALCHLRCGQLADAADVAREVFRSARTIGDRTCAGIGLSIWARACGGSIDLALVDEQLSGIGDAQSVDAQTTAELQLARALCLRARGDLDAALDSLHQAVATVHAAGLRQEYVAPIFGWVATVLRERAETGSAHDPALRRSRLREADAAARRARRWARSYRNNSPHADREAALISSQRGRRRRAARLIERSIATAQAQGARYEAALSQAASAAMRSAWAPAQAAALRAQTEQAAAELRELSAGVPGGAAGPVDAPSISLFDRFAALLNVGRAITAATSYPALETAIREAVLTLLRAERCELVPVVALAQQPLSAPASAEGNGPSRALLARAVAEGGPVVTADQGADADASLVLSGIRSALAAPIMVAGEPTTCLYATHRQIGQLFGEEEMQLAAFIATLAGAALEHLAGSETRFRSLAQNSSDVITLVDHDGVVSYQSSALKRVFALPPTTLLGRPVTDWVHPEDLDRFTAALASAGKQDDTRIECRFRHADGSYRVAETTVTNLLTEPTVGALVLNTRDVTDRNRAEEQLRLKNLELEKAGRAKDMFLASMSHELRTPLNAIIGFTGTLLMELPGPLNTEQARQLQTVQHSGKHLLTIINDLLDLAKIESGAVQLALEPVDCVQAVQNVITSLQPLAAEKSLQLSAALPSAPVMVHSDARALGQILINLVSNAIKFTDAGSIRVAIDKTFGGSARVSVVDTGQGIEETDLSRIFNAFERGSTRSTGHPEGTGLGLHICQRLAELIGAEITLDTVVGSGSTFAIVLPAVLAPVAP